MARRFSFLLSRALAGHARQSVVALVLGLLIPSAASAHVMDGPLGGFGSGFGHPLAGPDHFLAMLAVGLWGAQIGGRTVWTLPATFPMIM
ncbi:MAG: HupE/UreJ family protein, partial [Allorhizobium sp.]